MKTVAFARMNLAVGQKVHGSAHFGEGHNLIAEIGVFNSAEMDGALSIVRKIDHRALGVDLDLGFEPTLSHLAEWILKECLRSGAPSVERVRLFRGDGLTVELVTADRG